MVVSSHEYLLSAGIRNILLKRWRLLDVESKLFADVTSLWFIAVLVFYCIDLLLFARPSDFLPVSIAQPVSSGIMFSCVVILSNLFLGEPLRITRMLSLSLIVIGIIITNTSLFGDVTLLPRLQ